MTVPMGTSPYGPAYNLYYGMRPHCGRGTPGWRWLDIRSLASSLCGWKEATVHRIVYCTARVDQADDPGAYADQDIYLKALRERGSIDKLELGRYVSRSKKAPLARDVGKGRAEVIKPLGTEVFPAGIPVCSPMAIG